MADRPRTPKATDKQPDPRPLTEGYLRKGGLNTKFQIKERPAPPKPIPAPSSGKQPEKK